jgi:serine protease Do
MSTSKSGVFYSTLIALVSLIAGMVIASKLDLTSASFAAVNVPATNSAPITGPLDATTFRTIARNESPTVVSVIITAHRQGSSIEQFFGGQNPFNNNGRRGGRGSGNGNGNGNGGGSNGGGADQEIPIEGAGSGFIIDKAGFILTNNHVVQDADTIAIKFDGMGQLEEGLPAKVVGHDDLSDVALLQLTQMPKTPLPEAKFGDSAQMAAGDWVMAIGNPFELSNTVTVGVVSSVGRPITKAQNTRGLRSQNMIQTDAAINRGNSGGPLLNIRGEVIGINTLIYTDQSFGGGGGNVGIGFAIPINQVRDILPGLKAGKVSRGRIGVSVERIQLPKDLTDQYGLPNQDGAFISQVVPKGPAGLGGMKIKDIVVDVNGQKVHDDNDLVNLVMAATPGATVPFKVYRDRKLITLNITIGELDLNQENAASQTLTTMRALPDVESKKTALGIFVADVDATSARQLNMPTDRRGALVMDLDPRGDAVQPSPGILGPPDVILSVDGRTVNNAKDAIDAFAAVPVGHTATIVLWREDEEQVVLIKRHGN